MRTIIIALIAAGMPLPAFRPDFATDPQGCLAYEASRLAMMDVTEIRAIAADPEAVARIAKEGT